MDDLLALVDPSSGRLVGYVRQVDGPEALQALSNETRFAILRSLAAEPKFPMDVARELGVNEQLVYYHMAKLKECGLVVEAGVERRRGATATRYSLAADGFVVLLRRRELGLAAPSPSPILEELLRNGNRVVMVLGSPEPHGPFRGRGRDHYLAARLAYALGASYGSTVELEIALDTDPRLDLSKGGVIVVGGPAANMLAARLNEHLPVYFDEKRGFALVSRCSGRVYSDDNHGVVELIDNPFGSGRVLLIAGVHLPGTKAAFAALFKQGARLAEPNAHDDSAVAHVVEGVDTDGDGEVDDAVLLE